MRRVEFALLLLAATLATHASEPLTDVTAVDPRAFGHFIGDRLVRELSFEVNRPWVLDPPDGRQKLGRANAWAALIDSHASSSSRPDATRYHLTLTYQLINTPAQVELITMPGLDVAVRAPGESRSIHLPDWLLLLSPLTTADVREGLEAARPAREPRLLDIHRGVRRAVLAAGCGLLFMLWFCRERWGLGTLGRTLGPFAEARRTLRRLIREPAGRERTRAALMALHRAFDATAGERVFGERLPGFLARHPRYAGLEPAIQRFYETSRAEFFGPGAADTALEPLLQLSEHLSRCERASGGQRAAAV